MIRYLQRLWLLSAAWCAESRVQAGKQRQQQMIEDLEALGRSDRPRRDLCGACAVYGAWTGAGYVTLRARWKRYVLGLYESGWIGWKAADVLIAAARARLA